MKLQHSLGGLENSVGEWTRKCSSAWEKTIFGNTYGDDGRDTPRRRIAALSSKTTGPPHSGISGPGVVALPFFWLFFSSFFCFRLLFCFEGMRRSVFQVPLLRERVEVHLAVFYRRRLCVGEELDEKDQQLPC